MRYVTRILCAIISGLVVFVERSQGHIIDYQLSEGCTGILTAYTKKADLLKLKSALTFGVR